MCKVACIIQSHNFMVQYTCYNGIILRNWERLSDPAFNIKRIGKLSDFTYATQDQR